MIYGSLVLYRHSFREVEPLINCFLSDHIDRTLFIVDNSPVDLISKFLTDSRIIYLSNNGANLGFGAAHNIALQESIRLNGSFHFVINPDVFFDSDIVDIMVKYMEINNNIGMMMPEVLNSDESIQRLPKLLPSPLSIFLRKFNLPFLFFSNFINKYELRQVPRYTEYNSPVLSGCFTLLNLNAIKTVGLYDDRFFMYFEDWDLSRRMHKSFKTIYFPSVSIFHGYESGANKNFRLLYIFVTSAIKYFFKWGWFIDRERVDINKKAIEQFKI